MTVNKNTTYFVVASATAWNKRVLTFLVMKAVSDVIIYRYKYVIHFVSVSIKLWKSENFYQDCHMVDLTGNTGLSLREVWLLKLWCSLRNALEEVYQSVRSSRGASWGYPVPNPDAMEASKKQGRKAKRMLVSSQLRASTDLPPWHQILCSDTNSVHSYGNKYQPVMYAMRFAELVVWMWIGQAHVGARGFEGSYSANSQ
jgi:hypothetical protein